MPVLTDAELRIVVEVVTELAKYRGTAFDKTGKGAAFARAALIDPPFKARLVEIHRRLEALRNTDLPRRMLAPLLRELERNAEAVLSSDQVAACAATGARCPSILAPEIARLPPDERLTHAIYLRDAFSGELNAGQKKGQPMPGSVLIVHDMPSFLLESAMALGEAGHHVATFTDPMAALKAVEHIEPLDILITRVTFPEGRPNGIALARTFRVKRPTLKVIFAARAHWEAQTEGVGELVPHPVDLRQLVQTVMRLVTESQRISG